VSSTEGGKVAEDGAVMSLEKGSKAGRKEDERGGGADDAGSTLGDLGGGWLGSRLAGRDGRRVGTHGARAGHKRRVPGGRANGGGGGVQSDADGRAARRGGGRRSRGAGAGGGRGRGGRGLRDQASGDGVGRGAGGQVHALGAAPRLALGVGCAVVSGVARVWERRSALTIDSYSRRDLLPDLLGQQTSPAAGLKQ